MNERIGILHPGQMGISVAASVRNTGNLVYWDSEGRSEQTRQRAESQSLVDAGSLAKLCEICSILISVCPPSAAEAVAGEVIACSFRGLYVDANAISPQRAVRIGEKLEAGGAVFVDGSIVGPPAWQSGTTRLYLSGKEARRVASCFSNGPLQPKVIGDKIGKASALKMCYAAYTKGTTALLCMLLAAAEALEVRQDLAEEWSLEDPGFAEQAASRVRRVTAKAWRFEGEMEEIAATFREAGLPGEFHLAAAEIYQRLASYKGQPTPPLEDILDKLVRG